MNRATQQPSTSRFGVAHREWRALPPGDLADHLMVEHHGLLRRRLGDLRQSLQAMIAERGREFPLAQSIAQVLEPLAAEVESHLSRQEQVTFPMIRQLQWAASRRGGCAVDVAADIDTLAHDHQVTQLAMHALRGLTGNFTAPPDGSDELRRLIDGLVSLDGDLAAHREAERVLLDRVREVQHTLNHAASRRMSL